MGEEFQKLPFEFVEISEEEKTERRKLFSKPE